MLELARKALSEGNEERALEEVRAAIFCLATEIRGDFMTAACSCGHVLSGHRLIRVPEEENEREDQEAVSDLFLTCEPCSKRCVEFVAMPTADG